MLKITVWIVVFSFILVQIYATLDSIHGLEILFPLNNSMVRVGERLVLIVSGILKYPLIKVENNYAIFRALEIYDEWDDSQNFMLSLNVNGEIAMFSLYEDISFTPSEEKSYDIQINICDNLRCIESDTVSVTARPDTISSAFQPRLQYDQPIRQQLPGTVSFFFQQSQPIYSMNGLIAIPLYFPEEDASNYLICFASNGYLYAHDKENVDSHNRSKAQCYSHDNGEVSINLPSQVMFSIYIYQTALDRIIGRIDHHVINEVRFLLQSSVFAETTDTITKNASIINYQHEVSSTSAQKLCIIIDGAKTTMSDIIFDLPLILQLAPSGSNFSNTLAIVGLNDAQIKLIEFNIINLGRRDIGISKISCVSVSDSMSHQCVEYAISLLMDQDVLISFNAHSNHPLYHLNDDSSVRVSNGFVGNDLSALFLLQQVSKLSGDLIVQRADAKFPHIVVYCREFPQIVVTWLHSMPPYGFEMQGLMSSYESILENSLYARFELPSIAPNPWLPYLAKTILDLESNEKVVEGVSFDENSCGRTFLFISTKYHTQVDVWTILFTIDNMIVALGSGNGNESIPLCFRLFIHQSLILRVTSLTDRLSQKLLDIYGGFINSTSTYHPITVDSVTNLIIPDSTQLYKEIAASDVVIILSMEFSLSIPTIACMLGTNVVVLASYQTQEMSKLISNVTIEFQGKCNTEFFPSSLLHIIPSRADGSVSQRTIAHYLLNMFDNIDRIVEHKRLSFSALSCLMNIISSQTRVTEKSMMNFYSSVAPMRRMRSEDDIIPSKLSSPTSILDGDNTIDSEFLGRGLDWDMLLGRFYRRWLHGQYPDDINNGLFHFQYLERNVLLQSTVSSTSRCNPEINYVEHHMGSNRTALETNAALGHKILCIVYSISPQYDNWKAILDTWGKRCDGFFVSSNNTIITKDMTAFNIPKRGIESFDNIWQKVRSTLIYVHMHLSIKFDWIFVCGDDTYLFVDQLRYFLQNKFPLSKYQHSSTPLFSGQTWSWQEGLSFCHGGAGYVMNRAALDLLGRRAASHWCFPDLSASMEDVMVANCLKDAGVNPYDSRDNFGRIRFHHLTPLQRYNSLMSGFNDFIVGLHSGTKSTKYCCASDSISYHRIRDPLHMRTMHFEAYYHRLVYKDSIVQCL